MNDFLKVYQENKKVRDLIKHPTFKSNQLIGTRGYDNHDLKFKITHVKQSDKYSCDVLVNIKVCGRLRTWSYNTDENGMCDISNKFDFRSPRDRNRNIRRHAEKEIKKHLRLFGIKDYYVEIGKVAVAESL